MSKKSVKSRKKYESDDKPRINVTVTGDIYNQLQAMADKNPDSDCTVTSLSRDFIVQGLNGQLTVDNLQYMVPIIREQLDEILKYRLNNVSKIASKTCVQAGAAAYLCAEVISKFVPEDLQEDYLNSYESARKKAVQYMKGSSGLSEE